MFQNIILTAINNNVNGIATVCTYNRQSVMARIAMGIEWSIQDNFKRMEFAGQALQDIRNSECSEDVSDSLDYWADFVEDIQPTPCGSTEIWGSVMEEVNN